MLRITNGEELVNDREAWSEEVVVVEGFMVYIKP